MSQQLEDMQLAAYPSGSKPPLLIEGLSSKILATRFEDTLPALPRLFRVVL